MENSLKWSPEQPIKNPTFYPVQFLRGGVKLSSLIDFIQKFKNYYRDDESFKLKLFYNRCFLRTVIPIYFLYFLSLWNKRIKNYDFQDSSLTHVLWEKTLFFRSAKKGHSL